MLMEHGHLICIMDPGDGNNGRYNVLNHNCGTFVNAVLGTCNINKHIRSLFLASISPLPISLEDLIY